MTKYSVTIRWGDYRYGDNPMDPVAYDFDTKAELDAFLYGVAEMDGWMGYTIVNDGGGNLGEIGGNVGE